MSGAKKGGSRKGKAAPSYRIGDVALLIYNRSTNPIYTPGQEVEIVEGLERRKMECGEVINCYGVIGPGFSHREALDFVRYVVPDQLKKPGCGDPSKVVRWDSCPWAPKDLVAHAPGGAS